MRKILIAALIALLPTVAAAQQFPTVPSGTVIGRTLAGTGPAQAIPFSQLLATLLASNPTIPTLNTSSVLYAGSSSGTATVKAQAVAGTPTIQWPNTSGTVVDNATAPIVASSTTGNVSCANCAVSISTRAAAAAQDLSAYAFVRTNGYAAVGDGGGARFKNVGTTPFLDQHICGYTLAGGSGYTNGTYTFVSLTGGTGSAFYANITVSGGAVTNVLKIFNAGGFGYSNGDVLTTGAGNIGGTGSGFSITVNCLTTVYGSFTDSAGNHWQYIPENFIDPRQFGVKMDWLGTDGSATDNINQLQAAFNFASYSVTTLTSGGAGNSAGTKVLMPNGVAMICSSGLQMWNSTQLQGQGLVNSGIHGCAAFPGSNNFITIGDTNAHVACFGNRISDIDISVSYSAVGTSQIYALYTNCAQQGELINNVAIYPGPKGCLDLETGYGGAAALYIKGLFCTLATSPSSEGIRINYGTTLIHLIDTIVESSAAPSATGINALGGVITLDNYHSEGVGTPLFINLTTANHSLVLFNSTGGTGCTNFVNLASTNTVGNFALFNSQKNGCSTNLVQDGQPGGTSRSADAKPVNGWISFNP
ncbi:hypothetical protein ACVWZ4_007239 [Bradyrhizobium sp. USDA 4472]